jgi:cytochrome c551/c552
MQALDCKNCHLTDQKSIGPSFNDVAARYKNKPDAMNYLSEKIIRGGSGVWGETPMAAHPNLDREDAKLIVTWIQSLAAPETQKTYPATGAIEPTLGKPVKEKGVFTLTASYTDQGGQGIKPLTGNNFVSLISGRMDFKKVTQLKAFSTIDYGGMHIMMIPSTEGWFSIDSIDLAGVNRMVLMAGWQKAPETGVDIELRLDAPDGKLLSKSAITAGMPSVAAKTGIPGQAMVQFTLETVKDSRLHNLYVVTRPQKPGPVQIGLTGVEFRK